MELPVIFLVDPDVEAAEAVVSHLSAQGWWVSVVQDSDAALRVAAAHAPNLVIVHRRAAPFDALVEAFSRHVGGPGVILLEIDDETEVPAGADALLPGACDGPTLVAAARQLIREPREAIEEPAPVVAPAPVVEPSTPEPEELSEKFTSVDIFGDMLDAPVDDSDGASVVELTRVSTPLDSGAGSVTARVHFTGNAAAPARKEEGARIAGVALADLADPVEVPTETAQAEASSVAVSELVEPQTRVVETAFEPMIEVASTNLDVEETSGWKAPTAEVTNPEVINPELINPELVNPELVNPELASTEFAHTALADTALVDTEPTEVDSPAAAKEWFVDSESEAVQPSPNEAPSTEVSDDVHTLEVDEGGDTAQSEGSELADFIAAEDMPEPEEAVANVDPPSGSWTSALAEQEPTDTASHENVAETSVLDRPDSQSPLAEDAAAEETAPDTEAEGFVDWLSSPDPEPTVEAEKIDLGSMDLGSIDLESSDPVSEGSISDEAVSVDTVSDDAASEDVETTTPLAEMSVAEESAPAPEEPGAEDVIFLGEVDVEESADDEIEASVGDADTSAARWFEEGAVDLAETVEEAEPLEGTGAADLAQFEAIVESKQVEEPENASVEAAAEESDDESADTDEFSTPSEAWASVLGGLPADSADVGDDAGDVESMGVTDIEIPESAFDAVSNDSAGGAEEVEVIDLTSFGEEAADGEDYGADGGADDGASVPEASEESPMADVSEEAFAETVPTEEAARFVFPTAEEPSSLYDTEEASEAEASGVDGVERAGSEVDASESEGEGTGSDALESEELGTAASESAVPESEASESEVPESEAPESEAPESEVPESPVGDDTWTSTGYSFGETSDVATDVESVSEMESSAEPDEIPLPAVASSLADPPLPRSAVLPSTPELAEEVEVVPPFDSGTSFDSTMAEASPSETDLAADGDIPPSTFESLDSGAGRVAAPKSFSWLWMVAVVALLAVGGWLWLQSRRGGTDLPDGRSSNAAAAEAGEDASSTETAPTSEDGSEPASSLEGQETASGPALPETGAAEPELDSLLDEEFGDREREIRERFEIERKRLEEQLEALRSQRVEDATGTSQR